jgi:tRNA acetyltransferase TAN1
VTVVEFNFIATTFRYKEDDLIEELREIFYEIGELSVIIRATNIDGIVVGYSVMDPVKFIVYLREKLKDVPWEIRYLLRFLPIEKVVLTEISEIKEISIELAKKIPIDDSFKILIEKRHTNLKKINIINEIAPFILRKVDLTNPCWTLLIEIIGKYTGIAVINSDLLFSSMIEKRSLG